MRFFIIAFCLLTLSACATQQNYDTALQSWVGKDADELVEIWGPPDSVYERGDKLRILTYNAQQNVNYPATPMFGYRHGFYDTPYYSETRWCKTSFLVNKNRAIVNYQFHGDNCFATETGAAKKQYPQPLPWRKPTR